MEETLNKSKNVKNYVGAFNIRPNSSHMCYKADIAYNGKHYIVENQFNNRYERYTLLQVAEVEEITDEDIDFGFDFEDELFGGNVNDDEFGSDLEDEEEDIIKDDNKAVKLWKNKYAKVAEDDGLDIYDDDEDDGSSERQSYSEGDDFSAIQEGEVKQLTPPTEEQLSKDYYYKGNKVLFDFYRYIPFVGDELVDAYDKDGNPILDELGNQKKKPNPMKHIKKSTYGDAQLFDEIAIVINKALNFKKSASNSSGSMIRTVDNEMLTAQLYDEDGVHFVSLTYLNGTQYGYEYKDKNNGVEVTITLLDKKCKSGIVGASKIELPYRSEILSSDKLKELKLFKKNEYNRTVVFPDPKTFKTLGGLNLGYMDDPDLEYEVVDTPNRLIDHVEKHLMPAPMLAYDAETFGLKTFRWYSKPDLVCTHSFSWDDGKSIIIPIRMKYCKNIRVEEANEILKPVFETKPILAHNGAADVRFNMPDGVMINLVEDTMHLIRVIIPFMVKPSNAKGLRRAIDDLIKKMFGWDMLDLHKLVFGPAGVDFDFSILPYSYLTWYGCPDTDLLLRLWKILRPKLNKSQEHSYRQLVVYSKCMAILASYSGIGVDTEGILSMKKKAVNSINQIKQLIYATTHETEKTLPLSSSRKISNYVFGKLGVPASKGKLTSKNALSADKHVMKALAEESNPNPTSIFKKDILDEEGKVVLSADDLNKSKYPFCLMHRTYADLNKDVTAFYNRILNDTLEGVYYEFYQPGKTETYRDTGAIQITKKPVKKFLGAYDKRYFGFCSMDYNTEEFRITVNRSMDLSLIKLLQDPESDAHTMVAAEMYGLPPSEIDKHLRDPIKSCNFGIIYGMKVTRLTKQLKHTEHPTEDDIAEVEPIYNDYLYKRAAMLAPLDVARDHVKKYGWLDNDLGYRMIYSQVIDVDDFLDQVFDVNNLTPPVPHFDPERKAANMGLIMNRAGNYPIQSLAAAQLKDSVIRLFDKIVEAGLVDYVFVPLSVHDEIGVIYDKRKVDPYWLFAKIHECFYSEMEYLNKPKDQICPLFIGVGFGTSWGDAKSDLVEFPVAFQDVVLKEFYSNTHPKLTWEDDHMKHFSDRIKEYMKQRVTTMFQDMLDERVFKRHEMLYRINKNVFLGKKMHELFKTNDEVKDPETGKSKLVVNLDKYVALILEYNKLDPDEYTTIDGPEIQEEKKEKSNITEFYYKPRLHPIISVEGEYLTVDARNLYQPVIGPLANYLRTLHNPEYNFHNKRVRFMINNMEYVYVDNLLILGVPVDFHDRIEAILQGTNVTGVTSVIKKLPSPPIMYDMQHHYIIFNIDIIQQIGQGMVTDISNLISRYTTTTKTDSSYQILFFINGQYRTTDFYANGIPMQLPDDVKKCAAKYSFTY